MKNIRYSLQEVLKDVMNKQHPLLFEIVWNWQKIVGDDIALVCRPVKINKGRRSCLHDSGAYMETLYLQVVDIHSRFLLDYKREYIVQRVQLFSGSRDIERIVFC
ncbi:DUF721 domain-containing protein [Rickettsiales endosymbiont of Paramecium tredecaurelia]|uniref:DciA family protein n=1 Tax=Candidatus Sarmatiella mevalonica TaxID=2770581 RepID=UPI0019230833|nr:DciA family protein [Candidatus Sarmatiella mevalonica]MBL3284483.1 DUF721 domain-containing protein [Candidatus Sarmatiella mevalonica]